MSTLSDDYIKTIENNYCIPITQSQRYNISFNDEQKKMIESFCDYPVTVVFKDRMVGSSTTICSYICEYMLRNDKCNVLYKSINKLNKYIPENVKELICNSYRSHVLYSGQTYIKLDNDSVLFNYPNNIKGFKPDLIYISEISHIHNKEIEKIFNDLKNLWGMGERFKVIIECDYLYNSIVNSRFNKFVFKIQHNKNVNRISVNKSFNLSYGPSWVVYGGTNIKPLTFAPRKSIMSRYATKKINNNYYTPIKIK